MTDLDAIAREADIDLRALRFHPPRPYRIHPIIRNYSETIAAAYETHSDALARRRAAESALIAALRKVGEAREAYEQTLADAVLSGSREPEEPDVSAHLAEARRQAGQVRAMTRAVETARGNLLDALREHGAEAVDAMRDKAAGYADEALMHHSSAEQALGSFAGLRNAADFLDDWLFCDSEPVLSTREWNGVDRDATLPDARRAVGQ